MVATKAKRRVLIIVENLPVPFDRRVWAEACTLQEAGYQVSVICPRGPFAEQPYEVISGIHVFRHRLPEASGKMGYLVEYASALFWEFVYSLRALRHPGFDVIHACNPPDLIFLLGGFYKLLLRKKFLFDHHDLSPELYEAKFQRRGRLWTLLGLLEKATFRIADISIATNDSYRRIAVERGGMDPKRVFTVRSGPRLDRMVATAPLPAWKNGRQYMTAYVGVIGEQEGIDLLLSAVQMIVKSGRSDIQFVIVGSGPHWARARDLSSELGLPDFVTFTGRVDDATLMQILSTADLCVNPDRPNAMNNLSSMNKIMEYMAVGKPIVQFDLLEGRVSAGESSLYARNTDIDDFASKIVSLIDDSESRTRMGAAGRKRVVDELSWDREAPKLLAAYDALFLAPAIAR